MEPLNEKELNQLLRQWEAPGAPTSLRMPTGQPRQSNWRWLWSGSIRVPVPAGAAIVAVAAVIAIFSSRPVPQPVERPAPPPIEAASPVTAPPVENTSPPLAATNQTKPGALAGFRPVSELDPRIIGAQR